MRAALGVAVLSLGWAATAQAQDLPRLPRDVFDVIPPAERVYGERGDFRVWQTQCRIGPTDWARRRIVDIAAQEWAAFGHHTIDRTRIETRRLPDGVIADAANPALSAPRAAGHVLRTGVTEESRRAAADIAGYWTAAPNGGRALSRQNAAWSGPGGDAAMWLEPWSAAFVSWVMCEAGLGDPTQFARDVSHRVYIDQAIRARDALDRGETPDAAFIAHDPGEAEITPGDLLCNARGGADYRALADRRAEMDRYAPTHCDVVVSVDADGERIMAIGGNVAQSVSLTILPAIQREGAHLAPMAETDLDGVRTIFAHLKLRAPTIEPNALDSAPSIRALSAGD